MEETGKTEEGELYQVEGDKRCCEKLNLVFTTNYELELLCFHFVDVKSGIHSKMSKVKIQK